MKKDIRSLYYEELQNEILDMGEKPFGQNRFMNGSMSNWRSILMR